MGAACCAPALLGALLLLWGLCWASGPELLHPQPTVYEGPPGSYFGFSLDFYVTKDRTSVAVGAPRANTSQPGVVEPGAVFLCSWPPEDPPCDPVPFDTAGDETETSSSMKLHVYKSNQWLGASVTSWHGTLVVGACVGGHPWVLAGWAPTCPRPRPQACAPLQHWNAIQEDLEAFRTPVGACFMGAAGLRRFVWYSPCRSTQMASVYKENKYILDQRYCELGFSAAVTSDGMLALGAPGGYYFKGLLYLGKLDSILARFHGKSLVWIEGPRRPTVEQTSVDYEDGYRGYSVAVGEFDDNPKTKEYVVGVPNKSNTTGEVEIFSEGMSLRRMQGIASEQVASYFGHTVAVADINGDGQDDILVGAPLYMERRPEGKLSEVGRLYLYLQRGKWSFAKPPQTLTGIHPYGRFASAITSLGDLDKDGYGDVAVGAPFGGDSGSGQVLIFRGQREGLEPVPTQRLNSPFPGPAAFGFALRGATDLDGNGYMDLLVGAFGAAKVAVYRGQPVVVAQAQLSVPSGLNPEKMACVLPDSDTHVSCFPVVLCVSVTGQNIPQSIRLDAELQLDRLKQKLSRRVLLLQGHQASWHRTLVLAMGTSPLCHNLTAYLRDKADFKDKLSPIVTSLSLALASSPGAQGLGLVLYGDTLVQAQTHIVLEDCGEDNVCVPDLSLAAHTPGTRLLIGAENVVCLHARATNVGEGAFEAELRVQLPEDTYYQKALSNIQGQEKLSCIPRKENGSRVVLCELGNPMKAGAQITVDMELSVTGLEDVGDAITFQLQLRSKNSPTSTVVTVVVPVEAQAAMELRGKSLPTTMVLPTSWHGVEGSRRLEDHGIRVEHVYQLHNKGPATVTNVTLRLDVPTEIDGRILFYLLELGTEGGISCAQPPNLNPKQLEMPQPTGVGPRNGTHRRERREAGEPVATALEKPIPVDCGNATCVEVTCWAPSLAKDQRVLVSVRALLWMDTLQQREHLLKQFLVQSRGFFNTSAMPYRVRPHALPTGKAEAATEVMRASPDGKRDVPVWWVVLGVLAGLLLLTLLILLMWKIGFFKRTRPPMEEDTQEPGQAREMGGTQS
ncbi:integrin alpha-IIb isoform X4 [Cygnus olor]|uniref:integrin alpha-IIb isoform X4 n=1 Tax=Cygnus olor TaxID=8869 RepID=UPI001ADDFEB0|nr:integrin alpha-IIb isoform X4 [Cygnus olor]